MNLSYCVAVMPIPHPYQPLQSAIHTLSAPSSSILCDQLFLLFFKFKIKHPQRSIYDLPELGPPLRVTIWVTVEFVGSVQHSYQLIRM
jgi:hypothetical protein